MKTAVFINYSANNCNGGIKWTRIRKKVLQILPENTIVIPYEVPFDLNRRIKQLIRDEEVRFFISAGGDGTLNLILNTILNTAGRTSKDYCLGAIGLGSSNDFFKPFTNTIDGIPVKINADFKNLNDVGKVTFFDEKNEHKSRFFIINASLGITADANLLFNRGDAFIRFMKSRFTGLTILYTALKTLIRYKNKEVKLKDITGIHPVKLTNVSLTKNPYISGSFHYDQAPGKDSGKLGFHCSWSMTKMEIIKTLYDLSKGRFPESAKRSTSFVNSINVCFEEYLALETDGEVQLGKNTTFSTIPKALNIAS